MVGVFTTAHALTQEELVAKLQSAGHSQIGDLKVHSRRDEREGDKKNGKQVSLAVDSSGQMKERN